MEEKIFVVFRSALFVKSCLLDGMIDRAVAADVGMNGIMLILLVAASNVSSWRLSSRSLFLAVHGTRRVPWVYR
jgi:hypothetical protein